MMQDPNLANAGSDPTQRVPAPAAITRPLPSTIAQETKYYACPVPAASMHRTDGKKIPFVNGICETNILYDQLYLEEQIKDGSQYVREATEQEINAYKMHKDPHGTMKAQVTAEIKQELEQDLRVQLEAEIKKQYGITSDTPSAVANPVPGEADNVKLAGVDIRARMNQAHAANGGTAKTVIMDAKRPPITPVSTTAIADIIATSGK